LWKILLFIVKFLNELGDGVAKKYKKEVKINIKILIKIKINIHNKGIICGIKNINNLFNDFKVKI